MPKNLPFKKTSSRLEEEYFLSNSSGLSSTSKVPCLIKPTYRVCWKNHVIFSSGQSKLLIKKLIKRERVRLQNQ